MTRIRKVYISLVLLIVLITVVCLIIINQFGTFNFENSQMVSKLVSNTHAKYDYTGQNIKIAVIDSGIMDTHSDFGENIKVGYNFILDTTDTFDFNGHGTHVSGVIAAQDNEIGIKGIAPKAEIYPLLVLNEEGKGEISDVCEAISWCINNKIDIINLSFSTKKNDSNLKEVIDKATLAGIVVIASYNNDVQVHSYPAEYENVIGVKAHDKDLISFNDGIVYAPGKRVATTNIDGSYVYVDGNSIAAAYVAGFAALVKENYQNKGGDFDIDALYSVINNIGN